MNPYGVVKEFESELARYTGAKYAVTTNSCTMALLLATAWNLWGEGQEDYERENIHKWGTSWLNRQEVEIPKKTYVSVPQSIIHAGGRPVFRDEEWEGLYKLKPLPVWDSARCFTGRMFLPGQMMCVSFHASKILGDTQGGAILHDNDEADAWLRKARFDGRTQGVAPKDDTFDMVGWHCYLSNDVAARLLLKLSVLPKYNSPLPNDAYPDLSEMEIFK